MVRSMTSLFFDLLFSGTAVNTSFRTTASVIAVTIAALAAPSLAHAKRIGGGKSVRPAAINKAPAKPATPAPTAAAKPATPATPASAPAAAAAPAAPAAAAAPAGSGLMGTMAATAAGAVVGTVAGNAIAGAFSGSDADDKAKAEAEANKKLSSSITNELIRMKEAEARYKHGWVTVQGADAVVKDDSEK